MERNKLTTEQAQKTIDAFARRNLDKFVQESLERRRKDGNKDVNKGNTPLKTEIPKLAETVK